RESIMSNLICRSEYEEQITKSRDSRMEWWRDSRFGMFIHLGLYSVYGKHEWAMAMENWPIEEYAKFADGFLPKEGCCREWAKLAKKAGMKYMVLTTRHHEGFSLWDSKVNPFNSVNYGAKRDIVREFVDACHEFDLKVGFYSSMMDWRHPDAGRCAFDQEARIRFTQYIKDLNRELMENYGKIDILWYDIACPMESHEGWDSLGLNQMVRSLQPDIIINNRTHLPEDFQTPEGHTGPAGRDWEACMTFNGISWGYLDSKRVQPYSHTPQQILRMLYEVTKEGGNLLLNIGPRADGSIPDEAILPLELVGKWINEHDGFVYGKKDAKRITYHGTSNVTFEGNKAYVWNFFWPEQDHTIYIAGIQNQLLKASFLKTETAIEFEQDEYRITLKNLPDCEEDQLMGITMICLEFDGEVQYWGSGWNRHATRYPQINNGDIYHK
ncbi:alpha-L-fucosidase, partial [Niameybacter sp.]|uniref:alpha-L-fucosidase n=2 Tax=Niameybacter sp. TaxID=2033640 RepID=UPI002FC7200E